MQYINHLLVPVGVCWSLPQYQRYDLFYWQIGFTAILVSISLWRMVYNEYKIESIVIETQCKLTLLYIHNEKSEVAVKCRWTGMANTHLIYKLDALSRYTQFCIFLHLALKNEGSNKGLNDSERFYSTVLFKWQISAADFSLLCASINAR